jgi:hypothetical protein
VNDRVRTAATALLKRYPSAGLFDLYKSFFQDEFGPGHLLVDRSAALAHLDQELAMVVSRHRYDLDPCGLGRRYFRASLDLVVDELVDREKFVAFFLRGAEGFGIPDMNRWKATWDSILSALEPLRMRIDRFDDDAVRIEDRLSRGEYAIHHSVRYRERYDPHYRIFRCEDARALVTR